MKPYVLITGCTSGIGYHLAKEFAINGFNIVMVARNSEKLLLVKEELLTKHILPEYDVVMAFDDNEENTQMFLKYGISDSRSEFGLHSTVISAFLSIL